MFDTEDHRLPPRGTFPGGFGAGAVAALPVLLAVAPFGLVFGAVATEAGLDIAQTMAMTTVVIAGASQLTALQLLQDGAPALVAILAGAVVNLRMAMYSASLAVHWRAAPLSLRALAAFVLHDQSYTLSMVRARTRPGEPLAARLGFFLGVGIVTASVWVAATWIGAKGGAEIARTVDLSFMVPVCFIALVAPMLRGWREVLSAGVAAGAALLLAGLPYGLGLIAGTAAGIGAGLATRWVR